MKRSAIHYLSWVLIVVFTSAILVSAQTEPDDKAGVAAKGKITGRVVDQSGQPVAYAEVYVRGYAASGGQKVIADKDGSFEVLDLPPIAYLISAAAPTYVPRPRDPDVNPIGYYRIGETVRLEMLKGGVITGAVKRANGEPVVGIRVNLYLVRDFKGQPVRYSTSTREASTDDRGVYRIYGLPTGTYVVAAGGGEIDSYDVDPFASDARTYSPSSTRDTAAEITVTAGEETSNVDIRYRDEPGHLVSGTVIGLANAQTQSYQIRLHSIFNGIEQASYEAYQSPGTHGFVFSGVADGDYTMVARPYSESRPIKVRGADITGIELSMKPLASVSGSVVLEDSKVAECQGKRRPVLGEIVIAAWHNEKNEPKDQPQFVWGLGGPRTPDQQGAFTLLSLATGQYRFVTRPLVKYWYLKSIAWPPAAKAVQMNQPLDAARNWTTIKSGEKYSGLTITFAAGAASIAGKVEPRSGQKVLSRVFVYLTPVEADKLEDVLRYFVSLAAEDGTFLLSNLPPGRYRIVAKAAAETDTNMLTKLRLPDESELRAKISREGELEKTTAELKPCQNVTDYRVPLRAME
jgi:hypothetical protein